MEIKVLVGCLSEFTGGTGTAMNVALTEEQEEEIEKQLNTDDEDLVNVDGTKVKLSSKLIKHAEEMKRRSLLLKVPRDALGKKRKRGSFIHTKKLTQSSSS